MRPDQDLTEAFAREAGDNGFDVIIDYLWGPTTEALLAAIARRDLKPASSRLRLVQVGESAGPTISLAAAVLRSSRLEILGAGSGNAPTSPEMWIEAVRQLMSNIGCGTLRIETERVPLSEGECGSGFGDSERIVGYPESSSTDRRPSGAARTASRHQHRNVR